MLRLYENVMPFCIRSVSVHKCWCLWLVLELIPWGCLGITVYPQTFWTFTNFLSTVSSFKIIRNNTYPYVCVYIDLCLCVYRCVCVCVYESIWAAFAWMISEKTEVNSPWIHNACVFVFTYFCTWPSINTCESICNWGCPGPSYYTNQKTHSHRKLKLFVNISLHFINVSLDSLFLIPIKMFFLILFIVFPTLQLLVSCSLGRRPVILQMVNFIVKWTNFCIFLNTECINKFVLGILWENLNSNGF